MRVSLLARDLGHRGGVARAAHALAHETGATLLAIGRPSAGFAARALLDPVRVAFVSADLLHLETSARPRALIRDAALIRAARVPVVVRVHGLNRHVPRSVLAAVYGPAARVLAVCRRHADRLSDAGLGRVGVLSPGWVPHPALRKRTGGPPVVLFGGRATAQKGLDRLVAALDGLGVQLRVAGVGPVGGGVRLGWLDTNAWRQEVADADVVCLPSHDEGLSVVVLEAMAAGVPVVTTDVGGLAELVRDGVDGRVLPEDASAGALRDALQGVLEDGAQRHAMGLAAKERVAQFRIDVVGAQVNTVWLDVLVGSNRTQM